MFVDLTSALHFVWKRTWWHSWKTVVLIGPMISPIHRLSRRWNAQNVDVQLNLYSQSSRYPVLIRLAVSSETCLHEVAVHKLNVKSRIITGSHYRLVVLYTLRQLLKMQWLEIVVSTTLTINTTLKWTELSVIICPWPEIQF